jgi:ABC-type nickel/cobalt efflux system permease component RcnA
MDFLSYLIIFLDVVLRKESDWQAVGACERFQSASREIILLIGTRLLRKSVNTVRRDKLKSRYAPIRKYHRRDSLQQAQDSHACS